ncbi:hypothetical protein GCM10025857_25760 [Alicyclobacillus contaminans]|uniref:two-component system sensor histidine kinase NtrB n=1 Tax=Alicyclobacillus contaminans TaxID=392016 RepID=UPI00041DF5EA|nr:ATP-binding protein [Alicyclobacillus contaminans]GMA51219.1 hypothetical protein GCM10025857_25760 [Alicyclobacillus contaminans]
MTEQRYHRPMDLAPHGIAVVRGRRLVFVNSAAARMLGARKPAELVGASIRRWVQPRDLRKMLQQVCALRAGEGAVQLGAVRIVRQDGTVAEVELAGTIMRFQRQPAVCLILRDVSRPVAADLLLHRRDASVMVAEIAAGIAHEIRNPLTAVRGFAQYLHEINPQYARYYRLMLDESDKINHTVSELLALAAAVPHWAEVVDIAEVAAAAVADVQPVAARQQVAVQLTSPAQPVAVDGNWAHLHQVILNVLHNALDALPEGGRIAVSAAASADGFALVEVSDSGPGGDSASPCGDAAEGETSEMGVPWLNATDQPRGFGLLVSFHMVQLYGGTMQIRTQLHRGTCVRIRLPAAGQWDRI